MQAAWTKLLETGREGRMWQLSQRWVPPDPLPAPMYGRVDKVELGTHMDYRAVLEILASLPTFWQIYLLILTYGAYKIGKPILDNWLKKG